MGYRRLILMQISLYRILRALNFSALYLYFQTAYIFRTTAMLRKIHFLRFASWGLQNRPDQGRISTCG